VLPEQALLTHGEQQEQVLRYIPCDATRAEVRAEWRKKSRPGEDAHLQRWEALQRVCESVGISLL